jgi:hypothetical protein
MEPAKYHRFEGLSGRKAAIEFGAALPPANTKAQRRRQVCTLAIAEAESMQWSVI